MRVFNVRRKAILLMCGERDRESRGVCMCVDSVDRVGRCVEYVCGCCCCCVRMSGEWMSYASISTRETVRAHHMASVHTSHHWIEEMMTNRMVYGCLCVRAEMTGDWQASLMRASFRLQLIPCAPLCMYMSVCCVLCLCCCCLYVSRYSVCFAQCTAGRHSHEQGRKQHMHTMRHVPPSHGRARKTHRKK